MKKGTSAATIKWGETTPEDLVAKTTILSATPLPSGEGSASQRLTWLALLVVLTLSSVYTATLLRRGWIPHDEGTIGQSAERVLAGELPHRDFADVYTGGLSYLNALAFRLLGSNLLSPRIFLFLLFLAWVPAVYFIAVRFATPVVAGFVTLLAVAWSLPNYTAAVPSWYNLFFAVFGIVAMFRYLETNRTRWLLLAGICGGISFLFKLSGLYFIVAILFSLVFREQSFSENRQGSKPLTPGLYSVNLAIALVVFVALLLATLHHHFSIVALIAFVLPGVTLAAFCLWHEMLASASPKHNRFATLIRMLVPFGLGVALPIAIFLIPYFRSGSVPAFFKGVFILPARRLVSAHSNPPPLNVNDILATMISSALLGAGAFTEVRLGWGKRLLVGGSLGALLVGSAHYASVLRLIWSPLRLMIPLTVLTGAVIIGNERAARRLTVLRRQQLMVLVSVLALCTLVQVPFAGPIYFCYVAPLLVLTVLGIVSTQAAPSPFLLGSLLIFYLAFAVLRVTPGFINAMGRYYQPNPQTQRLALARAGGLRVAPESADEYERLISAVHEHTAGSTFIYCAPDCPEVYFLAGLRNPTGTLFDFLDDPESREQRVLQAIASHQVAVVIILTVPRFSQPMADHLHSALRQRFPSSTQIGRFEVRWRPSANSGLRVGLS